MASQQRTRDEQRKASLVPSHEHTELSLVQAHEHTEFAHTRESSETGPKDEESRVVHMRSAHGMRSSRRVEWSLVQEWSRRKDTM